MTDSKDHSSNIQQLPSGEDVATIKYGASVLKSKLKNEDVSESPLKNVNLFSNDDSTRNTSQKTELNHGISCTSFQLGTTEDYEMMQGQISGDTTYRRSNERKLKYPIENDLSSPSDVELRQMISEERESNVCVRCQSRDVCQCNTNLKTLQYLNLSRSSARKLRSYPRFCMESDNFEKQVSSPYRESDTEPPSMIMFWLHFFGVCIVLTLLLCYLIYLSKIISWNKFNVIQTFLCGGLFFMGLCWLSLVNFCHKVELGYKFSQLDYILTIFGTVLITIPWVLASLDVGQKVLYCGLISILTFMCIVAKTKESPSWKMECLRKCLFVIHIIIGFILPVIHFSMDKHVIFIVFSICAWISIFTSIYAAAMLMNKFYSHSHIYVEASHSIFVFEVLQVLQVVYLAMSIIQFANIYKLLNICDSKRY